MSSSVAWSRLYKSIIMFMMVSIWLESGTWSHGGSSSVTDSPRTCVRGTGTCFHPKDLLAHLDREAERVTPHSLISFAFRFRRHGKGKEVL